ncbi:uncharacterized protein LOC105835274 isoform X2 [Monomorium pharaonis]|uniref:uncharacterized protein LOC105835274 isoform X2 n=1 Tax=Monomorium pharaonis TaxID=307658 RepID=UPI001745D6D8|nr:uncharacterized protein LOC105835274 isoform X2 [Monomorium pharaonis]
MSDDDFIIQTLKEWGLEKWTSKFLDQEISPSLLLSISEQTLIELIPTIGARCIFIEKRKQFLKEQSAKNISRYENVPNTQGISADISKEIIEQEKEVELPEILEQSENAILIEIEDPVAHESKDLDIKNVYSLDYKKILEQSIDGRIIIANYKKEVKLNRQLRSKLVDVIITKLMSLFYSNEQGISLKNEHFEFIATQIVKIFPTENISVYYVPPKTEGPQQKISKGKLVDSYRNKLRECRKCGIINKKRKKSQDDEDIEEIEEDAESISHEKEKDKCTTHFNWLKYNTAPWFMVQNHWEHSRVLRQERIAKLHGNLHTLFEEWPVLKQPLGYTLETTNIFTEWPQFSQKLQKVIKENVKDKYYFTLYHESTLDEISEESKRVILLSLLPVVCPPQARVKFDKNKLWKPSIAESISGFILHIKTPGDIEIEIQQKRNKALELKQTVQPFIIIVGLSLRQIDSYYVVVDDVLYKLDNILKAIDICFKIFMVLDAQYPTECEQVWLFFQLYIYKQRTKNDKVIKSVLDFHEKIANA